MFDFKTFNTSLFTIDELYLSFEQVVKNSLNNFYHINQVEFTYKEVGLQKKAATAYYQKSFCYF